MNFLNRPMIQQLKQSYCKQKQQLNWKPFQTIYGKFHIYTKFETDWRDGLRTYKAGYYLEDGTFLPNFIIERKHGIFEETMFCPVCESRTQLIWSSSELPICPCCKHLIDYSQIPKDKEVGKIVYYFSRLKKAMESKKIFFNKRMVLSLFKK